MSKNLILLYHDIDSKEAPSEKKERAIRQTVVDVEDFSAHMAYLAQSGYSVISLSQYLKKQESGTLTDRDIVLTFDDGHKSNHDLALQILLRHDFRATFFVVADWIGQTFNMGKQELHDLVVNGMEIGSHSLSHNYLSTLTPAEVEREVAGSIEVLSDLLGAKVKCFAYPGGHYNRIAVEAVRAAGYKAAVSCLVGWNTSTTDTFLLRRLELRRGTSAKEFAQALKPFSIMFYQGVEAGKSAMRKSIGLERYRRLRGSLYHLYPFRR